MSWRSWLTIPVISVGNKNKNDYCKKKKYGIMVWNLFFWKLIWQESNLVKFHHEATWSRMPHEIT